MKVKQGLTALPAGVHTGHFSWGALQDSSQHRGLNPFSATSTLPPAIKTKIPSGHCQCPMGAKVTRLRIMDIRGD